MTIFVFLSTFAVYLYTLAPSITVGDSGEFCASSAILGLCHSPGYPLFSLLGKAAIILFPFANLAYRVNLLSALCGAVTAALLFRSMLAAFKAQGDRGREYFCLIAAMLFAFSPAFWKGAIQAEVFTINTLFAAAIIYSVIKGRNDLSVFAFGLGLGNHHTLVFAAPVIIAGIYAKKEFSAKRLIGFAALFALGFSVYAYLPARAVKKPALNWGNPSTLNNIVRDISRADYGSLSLTIGEKIPLNAANSFRQMKRFAGSVAAQFTVFGLALGIIGLYYGVKNGYSNFRNIVFVWLLAGPCFLLTANMPFNAETRGILERFYILVNLFWSFFILAGIDGIFAGIGNTFAKAAVFALVTVCIVAFRLDAVGWRGYYLEYDYGRNIFKTLAPGSIFFMDGGDDTFYSTAYLQFAEGRRKDVELHDRGGLVFASVYGADFRKLTKDEKEERRRQVEHIYLNNRPVYLSTFNRSVMPGTALSADGLLYTPKGAGRGNSYFAYSLRNVYDAEFSDYRSRSLAPVYPYFEALYDPENSQNLWRYALAKWPDAEWLKGNLKIELLEEAYRKYSSGDLAGAAKVYEEVLSYYPGDYETILNLGVTYEKQKNFPKAIKCYEKAIALEPEKTDAYYNIAVIYWQESNWETAVKMFEKMLELNPNDERAKHYLPAARAKLAQKMDGSPR